MAELPGGDIIVAGSSRLAMSQPSFGLNGVRIGAHSTKILWGVQHVDNYHGSLRIWFSSKELIAYVL